MLFRSVVGMLVSALFAGQHTSSSTGTWTGARLLARDNAGHLRAAVQEQERIMSTHGALVDYAVLQEMETLHRCVKETLRLHPSAMTLLRYARRSFTVRTKEGDEYVVPEGHTIASPLVIHNRLPHVYRDPERYEPDRFGAGRGEDGAGGAFSYTAFGGGRHACVGEAFAYMQMKVIWSHLLRNFEMETVSALPVTDWNVVMPGQGEGYGQLQAADNVGGRLKSRSSSQTLRRYVHYLVGHMSPAVMVCT